MASNVHENTCADCGAVATDLLEIRRRYLCPSCFNRYASSKILKRMESYSFRNQVGDLRRKLLLPLSGGPSSLVLLHALDAQLKRQMEKLGRKAYDLVLVHVNSAIAHEDAAEWTGKVRRLFPDHDFPPHFNMRDIVRLDNRIEEDFKELGLARNRDEDDTSFINRLFISTKTPTARSDLQELLLYRLLVAAAKHNGCESIIWGHSDSRLAAKALADVAKGRGGSIPNALADGPSPWGIDFKYPSRDLFKTELDLYTKFQSEDFQDCIRKEQTILPVTTSIRTTSIDALLNTYIMSQGEKYPGVMANVVRTAGKLQVPSVVGGQKCKLCSMPTAIDSTEEKLCYGCNRLKQDIKI